MREISAVLPTRNRAQFLPLVLEGLKNQTLCRSKFEIIAVNDGSTDETQSVLEQARSDLPIEICYQKHQGISAAKNVGILSSRSKIIVFIDDDDVAYPDLFEAHVAAHQKNPQKEVGILGHTLLALDVARSPLMRHVTQVGRQLFSYGRLQTGKTLDYRAFWGGRSSCKRSILLSHGIFNPIFKFGSEDIELAWRLSTAGFRVLYEPLACTVMVRTMNFDEFCARQERQGRSQRLFAQLHPCEPVRQYCEIDRALETWRVHGERFADFVKYVGRLDSLANIRAQAGLSPGQGFQTALDRAYRDAFSLCRSKGIAADQ